jgi:hypothetical protein
LKLFANENLFEPIIITLTDKIIAMKEANPTANTSALKRGTGTLSADRGEIEIKITEGRCEDKT